MYGLGLALYVQCILTCLPNLFTFYSFVSFITFQDCISFLHSFIHSLVHLVFIVLISIRDWRQMNRNDTSFVFIELKKRRDKQSSKIMGVMLLWAWMQGSRTARRGGGAGKCAHVTAEGQERNPPVSQTGCMYRVTMKVKVQQGREEDSRERSNLYQHRAAVVAQSWLSLGKCILFTMLWR